MHDSHTIWSNDQKSIPRHTYFNTKSISNNTSEKVQIFILATTFSIHTRADSVLYPLFLFKYYFSNGEKEEGEGG